MKAFPRRAGAPAAEPLTLAEAQVHLRVAAGIDDAHITALIPVVREACENRIERTLISTPWLLTLDTFPDAIELLMPPVIAVQSITYVDEAGDTQTLSPDDYVVDTIREPGFIVPAPGVTWPTVADGINNVQVAYTAGYGASAASVPASLKHWMLLALSDLSETRSAHGEKPALSHGFVDQLLQPYRILGA